MFIIKPQIDSFRDATFKKKRYYKCPILNINFSNATCHIDHEPPKYFDYLVFDFLKTNKFKFTDIELEEVNGIFTTFKNKEVPTASNFSEMASFSFCSTSRTASVTVPFFS